MLIHIKPTAKGTHSILIKGRNVGRLVRLYPGFFVPELTRRVSRAAKAGIGCYVSVLNQ